MPRSTYTAEIIKGVLVIVDQDIGRSVTNDAEQVLLEQKARLGAEMPEIVIYRDTTGTWDGLDHIGGVFRGFYYLNTRDVNLAIAKAKARPLGQKKRGPYHV